VSSEEGPTPQPAPTPAPTNYAFDPLLPKAARAEIEGSLDADGQPTRAYWNLMAIYTAKQFYAQASMRKMLIFFTVLTVLGLIGGLIVGIIGAVELHHLTDPSTVTDDPFDFSTP
jgi:hypothetical protein